MKLLLVLLGCLMIGSSTPLAAGAIPPSELAAEMAMGLATPGGGITFSAELDPESPLPAKPGASIGIRVESSGSVYLRIIRLDAHGQVEIQDPVVRGEGNLLLDGGVAFIPDEGTPAEIFTARLPLGKTEIVVVGSEKPMPLGDEAFATHALFGPDAGLKIIRRLTEQAKRGEFGVVRAVRRSYEVNSVAEGLSTDQIIQYFAETTRSATNPRLDDAGIRFRFNSADLVGADSTRRLDAWAQALGSPYLRERTFVVVGHTDDVGSDDFNLTLSRRRAEAVRDYLVSRHGIESKRLVVKGEGKSSPIAPGESQEARARNRRVDFIRGDTSR